MLLMTVKYVQGKASKISMLSIYRADDILITYIF